MLRKMGSRISIFVLIMFLISILSTGILQANDVPGAQAGASTVKFLVVGHENYETYKSLGLIEAYKNARHIYNLTVDCLDDYTKIKSLCSKYDVILMPGDKNTLLACSSQLEPLDGLNAVQNSLYAGDFSVNGKVLAVPCNAGTELIWYRKSVFKQYDLDVPQTWEAFLHAAREIGIKRKYIPVAIGGKDWGSTSILTQALLHLETGDKCLWDKIENQKSPFGSDKPFYKALSRFKTLFDNKAFGRASLRVDEKGALDLFKQKKAAMIYWSDDIKTEFQNNDDVGCFFLPVREKLDSKLNAVLHVSSFMVLSKASRNKGAAKDFINWHFGKDWYPKFINANNDLSTQKDIKSSFKPQILEAFDRAGDYLNLIPVFNKYTDFDNLYSISGVDLKSVGEGILQGKNFDRLMYNADSEWEVARKLAFGEKIDLSLICPGYKGTVVKAGQSAVTLDSSVDGVLVSRVQPGDNLKPGAENTIQVEVEYNLASQDKAVLTVGFNNGDDSQKLVTSASCQVLKGHGKYVFTLPVAPKRWVEGEPFFVGSQLSSTAKTALCDMYKVNLKLAREIYNLADALPVPILRGTVERVYVPVRNVKTDINCVKITKVTPAANLKAGKEINITVEVEYNLVTQGNAILGITFNNSENSSEADMENALWKVAKGKGKYIFTIPVTPKRWADGTPFRVGAQLHNFSDPDPKKHNVPLSDSSKVNLGVV